MVGREVGALDGTSLGVELGTDDGTSEGWRGRERGGRGDKVLAKKSGRCEGRREVTET